MRSHAGTTTVGKKMDYYLTLSTIALFFLGLLTATAVYPQSIAAVVTITWTPILKTKLLAEYNY
jgi:hypothetical protein